VLLLRAPAAGGRLLLRANPPAAAPRVRPRACLLRHGRMLRTPPRACLLRRGRMLRALPHACLPATPLPLAPLPLPSPPFAPPPATGTGEEAEKNVEIQHFQNTTSIFSKY